MDYVEQISKLLNEVEAGEITPLDCGIEASHIISDESLSYGELSAIEEELQKVGASLYEEDTE